MAVIQNTTLIDPCITNTNNKTKPSSPLTRLLSKLIPSKKNSHGDSSPVLTPANRVMRTIETDNKSGELERVFNYFDENGDGKISPSELRNCMHSPGECFSLEEVESVVRLSDSDGDGQLSLDDFLKLAEAKGEEEKNNNIMDAFRMYEMDGRDCITPKSLRRMLGRLGEDRTTEDCAKMIRRFDLNGDGVLSFDEFKLMMV